MSAVDAHVHLDLPCVIPKSDLWSSKKFFQAGVKDGKHSRQTVTKQRRNDSRSQES